MKIEFSWDEHKAEINLKKHGVAFEDATLVFYDAHALYKQDRFENVYRWQKKLFRPVIKNFIDDFILDKNHLLPQRIYK